MTKQQFIQALMLKLVIGTNGAVDLAKKATQAANDIERELPHFFEGHSTAPPSPWNSGCGPLDRD